MPFAPWTDSATAASSLQNGNFRLAKMVPLVTENSDRHSLARHLKRLRVSSHAPMQPQRGQTGSPAVDGQRAFLNHE